MRFFRIMLIIVLNSNAMYLITVAFNTNYSTQLDIIPFSNNLLRIY